MKIEVVTNAPEEDAVESLNAVIPDLFGDPCCQMNILVIAREVEIEQECECRRFFPVNNGSEACEE